MSSEIHPEIPPATAGTGPASPDALPPAPPEKPPGVASVMCPMGFTPYAIEGLTLNDPLFARVTYRPE